MNLKLVEKENQKACTKCKEIKVLSLFGNAPHHSDGRKSSCRACDAIWHHENYKKCDKVKKRNLEWKKKNKEWTKNYQRTYSKKNPEKMKDKRLKSFFGISLADYNKMFADQNGQCAICSRHQSQVRQSLGVDHNHKTGKIRKLLCAQCNHALGLLREDIDAVEKMAEYIRTFNFG